MGKRRRLTRPHQPDPEAFPSVWVFVLITAIIATAMRLCFPIAWAEQDSLASAFLVGDARAYHAYAAHLLA